MLKVTQHRHRQLRLQHRMVWEARRRMAMDNRFLRPLRRPRPRQTITQVRVCLNVFFLLLLFSEDKFLNNFLYFF